MRIPHSKILPLLAAFALATPLYAAPEIQPGSYVSAGGWGNLTVTKAKDGALKFSLQSFGANGHTCDLDGPIVNGVAKLEALEAGKPCTVKFTATAKGIDVKDASEGECRYYCGVRAGFADEYLLPPKGCSPVEVRSARNQHKVAYQAKKYQDAAALLAPVVENCQAILGIWEGPDTRNDLAVTYYHLQDKAKCLATLQPLRELAEMSEKDVAEKYSFAPSDAEGMVAVHKAAKTNLRLCNKLK